VTRQEPEEVIVTVVYLLMVLGVCVGMALVINLMVGAW
jgi:hypothetical protein